MAVDLQTLAREWGITPQAAKYTLKQSGALAMVDRKGSKGTRYLIPPAAVERASAWRQANAYKAPEPVDLMPESVGMMLNAFRVAKQAAEIQMQRRNVTEELKAQWRGQWEGAQNTMCLLLMALSPDAPELVGPPSPQVVEYARTFDADRWLNVFKRACLNNYLEGEGVVRESARAILFDFTDEQVRQLAETTRQGILAQAGEVDQS